MSEKLEVTISMTRGEALTLKEALEIAVDDESFNQNRGVTQDLDILYFKLTEVLK